GEEGWGRGEGERRGEQGPAAAHSRRRPAHFRRAALRGRGCLAGVRDRACSVDDHKHTDRPAGPQPPWRPTGPAGRSRAGDCPSAAPRCSCCSSRRPRRRGRPEWCLWCNTNKACLDYPVTKILPPGSLCKLSSARWGVCWVNFEALIITMSVLGGAVLLGVAVCCCCCCRRKKSRKPDKSEEKAMREREERRIRQEERRAEMKSRHDEIRKKYGLFKEENPYARFENN
uniref:PTTG1 interacting protein n=1 Tax=Equus caballus TaxID=9796 RepID=F6V6X5_HORSE